MSVNTLGTGPRCRGSSDVCLQVTDILAQEQSAIASLSVALGADASTFDLDVFSQ